MVYGTALFLVAVALSGCHSNNSPGNKTTVPDRYRVFPGKRISASHPKIGQANDGYRITLAKGAGSVFEFSSFGLSGSESIGSYVLFAVPENMNQFLYKEAQIESCDVFLVQNGFISKPTRKGGSGLLQGSAISDSCWQVMAEIQWKPSAEDSSETSTKFSGRFCLSLID
jgi:hypothetical protein